ncbi:DUF6850 family outer membrane beta-barrel protein [Pedobacter caeni]|uniref:DUF6850 domain-containing protein n=1 Tax=Pedobacter caeni TaxID=288992 RepID=A0A1M5JEA4_9SPHI|nr:DUF6850 family outer membrane beta-barrel protein [Pedobacter caeni]SHG38580.1 hypothetical protein SAMN04488522_105303 [Pedobacter caeni]
MKKIQLLILILQVSVFCVQAQKTDTTGIISLKNRIFAADSASFAQYQFKRGKAFFSASMPDGFNTISIGHQFSKGGYIPLQSGSKIKDTYLATEGKSTLADIALWGAFSYHKIVEDSTRWAHQTRNNPSSPYYYGSAANVNYQRVIYQLSATAERNMLAKNLPLAIGVDYRIGDHYSTNDPRGTLKDYQLNLQGSIGYQLSENLKAGLGIRYGYGEENTNVSYKNPDKISNLDYIDFITHVINGYNTESEKATGKDFRNDMSRYGFDAYLSYGSEKFGNLAFNASYLEEKQKFINRLVDSNNGGKINDYTLTTYNFDLIWQKKIQNNNLVISLNYLNMDGTDFKYPAKANNYLYNQNQWSAKAFLSTSGSTSYNYVLGLAKDGEERQDGSTGSILGYNRLKVNAGIGFSKQLKGNQSWGIHANGIYSMNLNDQFVVPKANETVFTRMVVYNDYLYHTSSFFGGSLAADYNFPTYKKIQTGIRLGFSYMDALKFKTLDRVVISSPGNNRFSTSLSLNLYF